jgi:hypothetical protein
VEAAKRAGVKHVRLFAVPCRRYCSLLTG